MMCYYLTAGLCLGLMTILDNGLELALGVHFAVNFHSAILFSQEGAVMPTETVWTVKETYVIEVLVLSIIVASLFLLICSKKYSWNWGLLGIKFENRGKELS